MNELLTNKIKEAIELPLKEMNGFCVEIKVLPKNNIQLFIDTNNGITIEECAQVNRYLNKYLEEVLKITDNYSLEVSSPGIDEPFKQIRQYQKSIDKKIELVLTDGRKKTGLLNKVEEDKIIIEEQINKETVQSEIYFQNIKSTKQKVKF